MSLKIIVRDGSKYLLYKITFLKQSMELTIKNSIDLNHESTNNYSYKYYVEREGLI